MHVLHIPDECREIRKLSAVARSAFLSSSFVPSMLERGPCPAMGQKGNTKKTAAHTPVAAVGHWSL